MDVNPFQVIGELYFQNLQHQVARAEFEKELAAIKAEVAALAPPLEDMIAASGGEIMGPLEPVGYMHSADTAESAGILHPAVGCPPSSCSSPSPWEPGLAPERSP